MFLIQLYAQQEKNSYRLTPQSPTFRNLEDFIYINASDFGNQTANNVVLEVNPNILLGIYDTNFLVWSTRSIN